MGLTSIWHWLIVLVIVLLVFGAGKLPKVAGDLAKGIKNFKAGLKDEDDTANAPPAAAPSPVEAPRPVTEPPKVVHAEVVTPSGATTETTVRKDEAARG